jgi:hypothetical protein
VGINGPSVKSVGEVAWSYTVTFTNQTTDVLDDVALFFQTRSGAIQFRQHTTVLPGERRVFDLGLCGDMVGYNMGIYIGSTEIFRIPASGSMTRQLASQTNPTDQYLCEDSWRLVEGP